METFVPKKIKKKENKPDSRAGVIILKKTPEDYKVLCLRIYGSYDLPKGGVESGEDLFSAAIRETEEESGISGLEFNWGLVTTQVRNVTLFIATTTEEPVIKPNPSTGEYEHHGAQWLTIEQAAQSLHPYLRPTMNWAADIIGGCD